MNIERSIACSARVSCWVPDAAARRKGRSPVEDDGFYGLKVSLKDITSSGMRSNRRDANVFGPLGEEPQLVVAKALSPAPKNVAGGPTGKRGQKKNPPDAIGIERGVFWSDGAVSDPEGLTLMLRLKVLPAPR